jgi:hypothetical protein
MTTHITNNAGGTCTPEFIPLPQRGGDPVFGLSRSSHYNLEKEGLIRLVRIRKPGQLKGRVLIDCTSVRKYLAKLSKLQEGARAARPANENAAHDKKGEVSA